MDRCQRADYSIERRGYERDEPRFELIFRKSKTRSSTRTCTRLSRLAIVSVSIRPTKGEGRSRKQLERRWWLHETAEALEEIPVRRIDRQRRAAVDKQPRIPTYPALYPKLKFDFPHWTFPLPLLLEQAILPWAWDEDRNVSDFQEERRFKILSLFF